MTSTHRSTPAQTAALVPIVRIEDSGSDGLKAERIQGAVPLGDLKLKAERIQLTLRDLPGWRLEKGARVIARTFELGSVREIARFLQYVAEVGHAGDLLPDVTLQGGRVTVLLPTVGGGSWIEPHHFALAKAFEVNG